MGIHRDIGLLRKDVAEKCFLFLKKCEDQGIKVRINETKRDDITQLLYYVQGRLDIENNMNIVFEYNNMRKNYKLWEVDKSTALFNPITWTLESKHSDGVAFDVVLVDNKGKDWWTAPRENWEQIGKIGEECGLTWGGRWKKPDCPHFEVR